MEQGFLSYDDLSVIEPDALMEMGGLTAEQVDRIVEQAEQRAEEAEQAAAVERRRQREQQVTEDGDPTRRQPAREVDPRPRSSRTETHRRRGRRPRRRPQPSDGSGPADRQRRVRGPAADDRRTADAVDGSMPDRLGSRAAGTSHEIGELGHEMTWSATVVRAIRINS